ncbi:MAG TPA: hypothetical protein EYP56_19680 [Planctomycetaceae bacterium]|nr:hypothetical protein [Planctomycetaceae bacterium]
MIAPLPKAKWPHAGRSPLHRARRWVAATLLPHGGRDDKTRPIAPWKAWLFAGWVVGVVLTYAGYMLGLIR